MTMGQIIYETSTSFDGYIADEHHSLSWLFAVPGGDSPELEPPQAAVQLMGSNTYEWVLDQIDGLSKPEARSSAFGNTRVFVFTSRQLSAPKGANIGFLSGAVEDALPAIREAAGDGTVWIEGGGDLAVQFLEAEALNECVFTIAPVALGNGAPLFPRRLESNQFTLTSAQQVGQFTRVAYTVAYPDR